MANNKEQLIKSVLDMKKAMADFFDAYTDMLMTLPVFEMTELAETVGTLETAGTLETPKTSEKVVPVKKSTTKKSKVEKQEVDEVDETSDETDDIYTKEALDGKKYNELKKIAKEVGVSAKGDRETLIDNILGASEQIEEDFDEDDEEETTLEDVEDEDDTDEDDGEEEDVEAEPIDDEESLAEEIEDRVSEMETEEIADLLVEAGISAKGKRQALINKLIKAVQDGAIAINGEGENEEEPEDDDYEDDEDEGDEEDVNDLSNPNIKPARKKALKALKSMLEKKYNDGKLKAVTMKKALKAYYDESADEIDDMDNDELFDAYLQLKMLFIDDEGDEVEEGAPYTLNGEPYCCGQPLQYNEEDDTFICEICGGEYESEEE
jgi:uncharacterized protein YdaT